MSRLPPWLRSVRFRLAVLVTVALVGTGGVLVVGLNVALDAIVAATPAPQTSNLETQLLRILGTGLGELGLGDLGLSDIQAGEAIAEAERAIRDDTLAQVRTVSILALLALVPVGFAIGWGVAGRVLRPVRQIAGVAREIETTDLSRRIHLGGPPDELRDLADTFDAMLDRLDRGLQAQRTFVEDASHELRNPLAVIRTTLDVALDEPDDPEALRRAAEVARRTADRMSTTVDELLSFARANSQPARVGILDLGEVVTEVAQEHEAMAAAQRVQLEASAPLGLRAEGDREALKRAQANLVMNAVRIAPAGSTVHCRAGRAGGWLWLGVRDTGPGIAPDDQPMVFQRAWHDGRTAAVGEARGIGLAVVRQVAEAHGGAVSVASRPGAGASFVIWLPDRSMTGTAGAPPDDLRSIPDPLWGLGATTA